MVDRRTSPPGAASSADTITAGDTSSPGDGRRRHSPLTTRLASTYNYGVTTSVIIPTRNRAEIWRSGWLLDSLRAQTEPPDELIVAIDHTEDDTLTAIQDQIYCRNPPFPVRILEVISPRPGPNPASAVPDNCLFAAATSAILVHLDDDIAIKPAFCRRVHALLELPPRAVIWAELRFVHGDLSPRTDHPPVDRRRVMATRHRWPTLADGAARLPAHWPVHWGGAWATRRSDVLAIGGHDLSLAGYRNADARLGNRLVRAGLASYITTTDDLRADHLGTTHRTTTRVTGPTSGPAIANGGYAYWTSQACRQSYREIRVLDSQPRQATI